MKRSLVSKWAPLLVALSLILGGTASAEAPYMTLTQGPDGFFVQTQTAYEPESIIRLPLNQPEDTFYEETTGKLYVADTGNARVVVSDGRGEPSFVGEGVLTSPTGVFVSEARELYVADAGSRKVFIFDERGRLLEEIGRPGEPIFGKKTNFVPKKVAVDRRGNVYVISEGSINGVIQMNRNGDFVGFIGANKTGVTWKSLLRRFVFSEAQNAQLFKTTPPSPSNISIDGQGLLYTVTNGVQKESIKKLNILGNNILPEPGWENRFLLDIDVDDNGNIYTLDDLGTVAVYDSFGSVLFVFGGWDEKYERAGFAKHPASIDVTGSAQRLLVTDKERGVIQTYRITPFASKVFEGVRQYKQGAYVESEGVWKDILRMNSFFILSYRALAKSYFKQDQYEAALESYKLGEDKDGYSDAFWRIRNEWLQRNAALLVFAAAGLVVLRSLARRAHRRYGVFNPILAGWNAWRRRKLVAELGFAFYFLRHPIDAVQELKENKRASVLSATIWLAWLVAMQVLLIYATGYLFSGGGMEGALLPLVLVTLAPLLLWVMMNYLVSTISDGEGRLSEVYIGTVYALTPYWTFALPIALLSNVLTYNESFVYEYSLLFVQAWSALLIVIVAKELHDYTFAQTLRNLFLTAFGIVLLALVLFILALLFSQEVEFIRSIIQELRTRV